MQVSLEDRGELKITIRRLKHVLCSVVGSHAVKCWNKPQEIGIFSDKFDRDPEIRQK
jgi:hypothetical protein